jgi:hypothetical protein
VLSASQLNAAEPALYRVLFHNYCSLAAVGLLVTKITAENVEVRSFAHDSPSLWKPNVHCRVHNNLPLSII